MLPMRDRSGRSGRRRGSQKPGNRDGARLRHALACRRGRMDPGQHHQASGGA